MARRAVNPRRGFTFIEVMVILLVVGIGLAGVMGLVSYGSTLASKAQAQTLAMATAISVAHDPQPRLPAVLAPNWSYTAIDLDAGGIGSASGFINGLYVEREAISGPDDVIARDATGAVTARAVDVTVTVYETIGGEPITGHHTRIVRRGGGP